MYTIQENVFFGTLLTMAIVVMTYGMVQAI